MNCNYASCVYGACRNYINSNRIQVVQNALSLPGYILDIRDKCMQFYKKKYFIEPKQVLLQQGNAREHTTKKPDKIKELDSIELLSH